MDATRARFESFFEWAVAGAFAAGVVLAGSVAVREFRTVHAIAPVIAREAPPEPLPAGVPSRAVSVPLLLLADGKELRVGETLLDIAVRLNGAAIERRQTIEQTPYGERVTRVYEAAGTQFVLVFEPFARGAEPRVAAIYLQ